MSPPLRCLMLMFADARENADAYATLRHAHRRRRYARAFRVRLFDTQTLVKKICAANDASAHLYSYARYHAKIRLTSSSSYAVRDAAKHVRVFSRGAAQSAARPLSKTREARRSPASRRVSRAKIKRRRHYSPRHATIRGVIIYRTSLLTQHNERPMS